MSDEQHREGSVFTTRSDNLTQQWTRQKVSIPLRTWRSIAATVLESHANYGRYVGHFLGHSPHSIAAKHYAAPSQVLFDEAMAWLRVAVLGV